MSNKHDWEIVPGPDTDFVVRLQCTKCKEFFEQDMYSLAPEHGCIGDNEDELL